MSNMSNTNPEISSLKRQVTITIHFRKRFMKYMYTSEIVPKPVYSPLCMREVCWYSMYINAAALQSFFQYVARNLSSFISECGKQQETPAASRLLEIQLDRCMQISSYKSLIAIFKFCPNIYLVAIPPKIIPTKLSAYTIYLLYTCIHVYIMCRMPSTWKGVDRTKWQSTVEMMTANKWSKSLLSLWCQEFTGQQLR